MALNLLIKNNSLHHAYCILGDSLNVVNELEKFFLKELNFSISNNPDFWYEEFDVMDIDDGRAIKILHQNKPSDGDKKIFVVSANFITEKAQNAMLKLFEEPMGNTHFFLVLPSLNNIISTFRSRLFIIDTGRTDSSLIDSKEFLKMSINGRMKLVKNMCDIISDGVKSKMEIIKFIDLLEIELKKKINFLKTSMDEIKLFEDVEMIRQYAGDQSPSLKMLLEHLSLLLPVFKS